MICPWLCSDMHKAVYVIDSGGKVTLSAIKCNFLINFQLVLPDLHSEWKAASHYCGLVMDISSQGCYSKELNILTFKSSIFIALKFQITVCVYECACFVSGCGCVCRGILFAELLYPLVGHMNMESSQ